MAGIEPFRVCMRAFLEGRLHARAYYWVYFDLSRMAGSGIPEDEYWVLNRGMHDGESFTENPELVGYDDLIGEETLRERIAEVSAEIDRMEAAREGE